MPRKFQRTYGRKDKKEVPEKREKYVGDSSLTDVIDSLWTEHSFQERVGSPDVIGCDWNDTFDKLIYGSKTQCFTQNNHTSDLSCHIPSSGTEFTVDGEGKENITGNLKTGTEDSIIIITDSENDISSFSVTDDKHLIHNHNVSAALPKLLNSKWDGTNCMEYKEKSCNAGSCHTCLKQMDPNNSPRIISTNNHLTNAENNDKTVHTVETLTKPVIKLQPGKKWRRSLSGFARNRKEISGPTAVFPVINKKIQAEINIDNIQPGKFDYVLNDRSGVTYREREFRIGMKPIAESSPKAHTSSREPLEQIFEEMHKELEYNPKISEIWKIRADISKRLCFPEMNQNKMIDLSSTSDEIIGFIKDEKTKRSMEIVKHIFTNKPTIRLQSGKKWRRSLSMCIQNKSYDKSINVAGAELSLIQEDQQDLSTDKVEPDFKNEDVNDNIANLSIVDKDISYISISSDELESDVAHKSTAKSRSVFPKFSSRLSESSASAYEVVLRRCGQTQPLPFDHCYSDIALQKCHKIGEGLFGEVFLYKDLITGECSVLKIIPIEGSLIVNGEKQKNFDEILAEIIIVMELSELHTNSENATSGFCPLKKISCVKGKYPETLLDLWELYDEQRGSENDNPQVFGHDQLYIVLELGNAGGELESFRFTNAKQSLSVFRQIAFSLAVAERALEFEHRDLHWGNVLIVRTSEEAVSYKIDGRTFSVPLHGVKATIIDFSYSRITFNGQAFFSDLGTEEELFSADGDYQFDIYRHMRQKNLNNWSSYQPYSNILWLHYLVDKMIAGVKYVNTKSKVHNFSILDLQFYKDSLLSYDNINAFVEDFNYFS